MAVDDVLLVAGDEARRVREGEGDVHGAGTDAHLGSARPSAEPPRPLEGADEDGVIPGDGDGELRGAGERPVEGDAGARRDRTRVLHAGEHDAEASTGATVGRVGHPAL